MGQQIDLLKEFSEAGNPADQAGLDRVRLGSDEVVVYMFTSIAEKVDLHFCSEADINDYVLCNGKGCVLCQIGRNLDQRRLMAVYVPEARAVAVLPVGLSQRPYALLPQLLDVLKAPEPQVVFIRRGLREHYRVEARPIPADCDAGESRHPRVPGRLQRRDDPARFGLLQDQQRGAGPVRSDRRSPPAEGDQSRMTVVLGEQGLAAFREHWNGARLLDLIAEHGGGILVTWPIGVGKSHAIDRIIEAAVGSGRYDLVIALAPTRRVLEELRLDPKPAERTENCKPPPPAQATVRRSRRPLAAL